MVFVAELKSISAKEQPAALKPMLLLLLALLSTCACALSFEAEELSFRLEKNFWEMDGLFYFSNLSEAPISQNIYFPIPEDSLCLHPKLITLEVSGEDSLANCKLLQQGKGGFTFLLSMPEKHFCTLRIVYRQLLLGDFASYIITTANAWGKPLQFASYKLDVARDLVITKLPFPDAVQNGDTYFWEFYDFTPSSEFRVEFKRN